MNTKQLNKLTMYLAVEGICDANNTVWQTLQAFADAYTDLKTHVTNIQTFSQSQAQDTSGVALDKQAARQAMCAASLADLQCHSRLRRENQEPHPRLDRGFFHERTDGRA